VSDFVARCEHWWSANSVRSAKRMARERVMVEHQARLGVLEGEKRERAESLRPCSPNEPSWSKRWTA